MDVGKPSLSLVESLVERIRRRIRRRIRGRILGTATVVVPDQR